MTYRLICGGDGYKPYGAAEQMMYCQDREVLIEGGAETGKTLACCWKIHLCAIKYPGSQLAMVRKVNNSMYGTVLKTFARVVKEAVEDGTVKVYGGEKPEMYLYNNGSTIWVGGMDNPDKILSSERDMIYYNQAEESNVDEWEKLVTRTTGRSAIMPYTQLIADANPAGSKHHLMERRVSGRLTWLHSVHKDNPTIYNRDGSLTEYGTKALADLASMTGIRRKRLFEGLWVTAEGAVYDMFDYTVHAVERPDSEMVEWYISIDEGYTNPAVITLVGMDSDKRAHVAREWYHTGKLQSEIVQVARDWMLEKNVRTVIVDEAAAGLIADLRNNGIPAFGAKGKVLDGIHLVQDALKVQGDGKPRLTISKTCINGINEFESYVWKPGKDEPVKENDHELDSVRYLYTHLSIGAGETKLYIFGGNNA